MPSELRTQRESERKARTRSKLLNAANTVFLSQGYHATLISDIVAQADVGQGTFYRHFSSKRDIFRELVERFISELIGKFSEMSHQLPTTVEEYHFASVRGTTLLAETVLHNRDIVALLVREAPAIDRELEGWFDDMRNQFAALAQFFLDHAISQGFARPCNSSLVAEAIVGMGMHFITRWSNGGLQVERVKPMIGELVDFAFFGLAPWDAAQRMERARSRHEGGE